MSEGNLEDLFDDEEVVETIFTPAREPDESTDLVRIEDVDAGGKYWMEVDKKKLQIQQKVNEYQIQLITGEVPMESLDFIKYDSGEAFVYLAGPIYIDMLNHVFGFGKWRATIDKRECALVPSISVPKWETRVEGKLLIPDHDIEIWSDGGFILKDRANQCVADGYKAAKTDMIKTACIMGLGFALDLKDQKFQERALVHFGACKPPGNFLNNLKGAVGGAKSETILLDKLKKLGLDVEPWELKSFKRVKVLLGQANARK